MSVRRQKTSWEINIEMTLNEIHTLATNDDHLLVTYRTARLEMAHAVMAKMEVKLNQIADLVQVALGD